MCPSSSAGRQLAISPEREDEDDIGTESLALLQMDIGADLEQNVAQGSSGNRYVGHLSAIVFLFFVTIRADDERDMNAATSKYVVYVLSIETSLLPW